MASVHSDWFEDESKYKIDFREATFFCCSNTLREHSFVKSFYNLVAPILHYEKMFTICTSSIPHYRM